MSIENLPFFIIKKRLVEENTFLQFEGMSLLCSNYLGWDKPELAYGKYDYDIPSQISELAPDFNKFDHFCMTMGKELQTLEILDCSRDGKKSLLIKRIPTDNHIVVCGMDISHQPFYPLIYSSLGGDSKYHQQQNLCYVIGDSFEILSLSPSQEKCLYYLVRGKTAKETAHLLGIHYRTVEEHIERIKNKLGCRTKSDLIEKAFESGFIYFIPQSIAPKEKSSLSLQDNKNGNK